MSAGNKLDAVRELLKADLFEFAKYVNPLYMYGDTHAEVCHWLQHDGTNNQELLLMPRGHLKSHLIACWCAWYITKFPYTSIMYLSAGESLAMAQIDAIKEMMTSDRYRKLWPDMINREEARRSRWTAWGFNVDHPLRKQYRTRDMTIIVKTLKSNFVGHHCDAMVYDDIVVDTNAYTEGGREDVKASVAKCASIKNPGAITKAVGTIYHPADVYSVFKTAVVRHYDEKIGDFGKEEPLWDIKEYVLEDIGDLTGKYLWPSVVHPDNGKTYGFDIHTAAQKQAEYFSQGNQAHWYAQYYNQANDPSSEKVSRDAFQFYDEQYISIRDGNVYYNQNKLNILAAMDVAWTTGKDSDYTAIGVVGVDSGWNFYVLDLVRFKTQDYDEYYQNVIGLYNQWGFRKILIETNAGGTLVAREIKNLIRQNGGTLVVDGRAATSNEGKKHEKHAAVLIPRVKNNQVFFKRGGLTPAAIEEIVLARPAHDDLKDVLTTLLANLMAPSQMADQKHEVKRKFHKRFGGRIRG